MVSTQYQGIHTQNPSQCERKNETESLVDAHPVGPHRQRRVCTVLCTCSSLLPCNWRTVSGTRKLKRSKRQHTLVFQATSKVLHDHPCVDKSHDEKNDGDDSCNDVRSVTNLSAQALTECGK